LVRRRYESVPEAIAVDHADATPLFRQLYHSIREAILAHLIEPGERLPSTRVMAKHLAIARNTVTTAFEQLLAEGYLESRVGAGTVVARDLPIEEPLNIAGRYAPVSAPARVHETTPHASAAMSLASVLSLRQVATFEIDTPAYDAFAFETMRRLLSSRARRDFRTLFDGSDPAGLLELRKEITDWVWTSRGIRCTPDQVVITSGGQHAMELLVRTLVRARDKVVVEDPGEISVRTLLMGTGAKVQGIPVDDGGMCVERLEDLRSVKLAHVTPSNQYPVGGTMGMSRRLALLNWASRTGALIVEDDCDSEFRYSSRPLAALKGLDSEGLVVYVGTFSRILLPSIRLGYLILPSNLVQPILAIRALGDRHPPPLEQWLVADFIANGHFMAHVRRMRKLYAYRQNKLVSMFREHLSQWLDVRPAGAGMNVVGWLPPDVDDRVVAKKANDAGIMVRPASIYFYTRPARPGLLVGHSAVTSGHLRRGVRTLSTILSQPNGPENSILRQKLVAV
jgi:GntR family transcriptional regulator/MocR family aminotransferase